MTDPTTAAADTSAGSSTTPPTDPRVSLIAEALTHFAPQDPAVRIWGRAAGADDTTGAPGNVWAGSPLDVAEDIVRHLNATTAPASPYAQADAAKQDGDFLRMAQALNRGYRELLDAPWYPPQPGDLVHVAYQPPGELEPFGETYAVRAAGDGDLLMSLHLVHHTYIRAAGCQGCEEVMGIGAFATGTATVAPLAEAWMEAGPHRLTIVRNGVVLHDGPAYAQARAAGGRG